MSLNQALKAQCCVHTTSQQYVNNQEYEFDIQNPCGFNRFVYDMTSAFKRYPNEAFITTRICNWMQTFLAIQKIVKLA